MQLRSPPLSLCDAEFTPCSSLCRSYSPLDPVQERHSQQSREKSARTADFKSIGTVSSNKHYRSVLGKGTPVNRACAGSFLLVRTTLQLSRLYASVLWETCGWLCIETLGMADIPIAARMDIWSWIVCCT